MLAVILSRKRALYSTRRLRQEFQALGCTVRVVDPLSCVISMVRERQTVLARRRDLGDADVVIPRIGTYGVGYAVAVVRQFRLMGVPCINDDEGIGRVKNKIRCLQYLRHAGIPIPETLAARSPLSFEKMVDLVGGPPVILKLASGMQGTGVILSESVEAARSSLEAFWSLGADLLMQNFVSESRGRDVRVLVIGREVRAAMRRVSRDGEFRSNMHRGAVGEPIIPEKEQREIAIRAARAVGLELAGVDMLETREGPRVLEVNASPGFQGLEEATGLNIARMIAEHALTLARRRQEARA